jgi:hypothetical protein
MRVVSPSAAALLLALASGAAWPALGAQTLSVTGAPSLTITTGTPGTGLTPASDGGSGYTVTTVAANQKLVARLEAPLPPGVTLQVQLSGPTSAGPVTLTTSDQPVLGAIATPDSYSGTVTYTLTATVSAGPVATIAPAVRYSLVAGP